MASARTGSAILSGLGSVRRRISSTAHRGVVRPKKTNPLPSASQPVLKKDVRPTPAPPRPPSTPRPTPPPPEPAAQETKRGGKQGSVYASYQALPYNTKLVFWTCGAMFATLGLLAADKLEELFPARNNKPSPNTDASTVQAKFIEQPDSSQHQASKSKLFSISVVDRS